MEVVISFALQLLFGVGVLILFGILLEFANTQFLRNTGRGGNLFFRITGAVGTPIHELSHAAMCILFGHRMKEICLYNPRKDADSIGYVHHVYHKNNLYHRVGNFFIGIAPMLGGTLVIFLLIALLLPDTFATIWVAFDNTNLGSFTILSDETFAHLGELLWTVISSLFVPRQLLRPTWWLFLVLALMITLHLDISPADLSTALLGFWIFAGILLAVNLLLFWVSPAALQALTAIFISVSVCMAVLILPAVVLILLLLGGSYLVRLFR